MRPSIRFEASWIAYQSKSNGLYCSHCQSDDQSWFTINDDEDWDFESSSDGEEVSHSDNADSSEIE
jgi:hypothetical protein